MRAAISLSQVSTLSSVPRDFHFESDARRLIPTPVSSGSQPIGSRVFDPSLSVTVCARAHGGAIKCHSEKTDAGKNIKSIKPASAPKIAAFIWRPDAGPRCRGDSGCRIVRMDALLALRQSPEGLEWAPVRIRDEARIFSLHPQHP